MAELLTLADKTDTYNFSPAMLVSWGPRKSWLLRLWYKLTPWWDTPPWVTEAINHAEGQITLREAVWSWRRWRWV